MYLKRSLKNIPSWTLCTLLVLSMLAAALPKPALAAAPAATCDKTYTVKGSESIYRIAREEGVSVNRLAKTNGLKFPYTLTPGQELCIPELVFSSLNARWSLLFTNNRVRIDGSGFKKEYNFIVRVRENDTTSFVKLGKFKTDKDGKVSTSFDVPKELQRVPSLIFCLKDAVSDALVCKQVYRL